MPDPTPTPDTTLRCAWPTGWEQNPQIDDGHAHDWQMVVVQPYPGSREAVTCCAACKAPRCGHTFAADPCLERRHHEGLHVYESGRHEPVGGYLRDETAR